MVFTRNKMLSLFIIITHGLLHEVYKLFVFIYLWWKQRQFYRSINVPGFTGIGHWFFGHTQEIQTYSSKQLLEKFPSFFKYSIGLFGRHVRCYNPQLVKLVIENSEKAVDLISVDQLLLRGQSIATRGQGEQLKFLRLLFHKCYGSDSKQYHINICKDIFNAAIDNFKLSKDETKLMQIKALTSEIEFKLPNKIWFGDVYKTEEQDLKKHIFRKEKYSSSVFTYIWTCLKKILVSYNRRTTYERIHKERIRKREKILIGKDIKSCHAVLDKLIILKMAGEIRLSNMQITSLYLSNLTFAQSIRDSFSWLVKSLAENKHWQDKILQEIGDMRSNGFYDDNKPVLDQFHNLNLFVYEAMRVNPTGSYTRRLTERFEFDGVAFEKGTLIDIDMKLLFCNPAYWESPEKFMPERFFGDYQRHLYAYIPFFTGARICPAKSFVVPIIKIFLITFVERLELECINSECNGQIIRRIKITARA